MNSRQIFKGISQAAKEVIHHLANLSSRFVFDHGENSKASEDTRHFRIRSRHSSSTACATSGSLKARDRDEAFGRHGLEVFFLMRLRPVLQLDAGIPIDSQLAERSTQFDFKR